MGTGTGLRWFLCLGQAFRLTARVLLYTPYLKQDSTYNNLCYASHGPLAGTSYEITKSQQLGYGFI